MDTGTAEVDFVVIPEGRRPVNQTQSRQDPSIYSRQTARKTPISQTAILTPRKPQKPWAFLGHSASSRAV